ncbi:hypothetical protein ACTXT7_015992 [Hymenolepis weldensis]
MDVLIMDGGNANTDEYAEYDLQYFTNCNPEFQCLVDYMVRELPYNPKHHYHHRFRQFRLCDLRNECCRDS